MNGRLYHWHRRVGLVAAVLVAVLAATGVALNHETRLGTDRRVISHPAVVSWYAARVGSAVSYAVRDLWVTSLEGRVFADGRPTGQSIGDIRGAVAAGPDLIAVAGPRVILLLAADGRLVERVATAGFSGEIDRIGATADGRIVVQSGTGRFAADRDLVSWSPTMASPSWARPAVAPRSIRTQTMRAYMGGGVPLSRVLLDLHTGRILGTWGPWLMDAAALCLRALAVTGLVNWWRGRRTPVSRHGTGTAEEGGSK